MKEYTVIKGELSFNVTDFETDEEMNNFLQKWVNLLKPYCSCTNLNLSISRYFNEDAFLTFNTKNKNINFGYITIHSMPQPNCYILTYPTVDCLVHSHSKDAYLMYGSNFVFNILKVVVFMHHFPSLFEKLFKEENPKNTREFESLENLFNLSAENLTKMIVTLDTNLTNLSATIQQLTEENDKKSKEGISISFEDDGIPENEDQENISNIPEEETEFIGIREISAPKMKRG